MERDKWLQGMREKLEAVYDHLSPAYLEAHEGYANEAQLAYLEKFLERMGPGSELLSAACGAGRYDGILLEAGHRVLGIDQSEGMLQRAGKRCPGARYRRMRLQEMDFTGAFDGILCIDAMEHISPEDWPVILERFREALKPGGLLYFTYGSSDSWPEEVEEAHEKAQTRGLPAVYGELAYGIDEAFKRLKTLGPGEVDDDLFDLAAYHFCPTKAQVRGWVEGAGLAIEEEGFGDGYEHVFGKKASDARANFILVAG